MLDTEVLLGKFNYWRKKTNGAIHVYLICKVIISLKLDNANHWLQFGKSLEFMGNHLEALKALKRASARGEKKHKGTIFLKIAEVCNKIGLFLDAEKYFKGSYKFSHYNEGFYWIARGRNWVEIGELDKALDCFNIYLESQTLVECKEEAYLNRAWVWILMDNFERAKLDLRKAIDIDPKYELAISSINKLNGIEEILAYVENYKKIQKETGFLELNTEDKPISEEVLIKGIEEYRTGNWAKSRVLLNFYVENEPADWRGLFYLGDSMRLLGLIQKAEKYLLNSLEVAPIESKKKIYFSLGQLYKQTGDRLEADSFYSKALKANGNEVRSIYFEKGENLFLQGEFQSAKQSFEKAKINSGSVAIENIYFYIGKTSLALEDFDYARESFAQALNSRQNFPEAKHFLSCLDDIDETIAYCQSL